MLKLSIDVYNKSKSSTEEEKKRKKRKKEKKREKRKKKKRSIELVPQVKQDNEASFRALPKAIRKVNVRWSTRIAEVLANVTPRIRRGTY